MNLNLNFEIVGAGVNRLHLVRCSHVMRYFSSQFKKINSHLRRASGGDMGNEDDRNELVSIYDVEISKTVENLGVDIYLKSGEPIILCDSMGPLASLANTNGWPALQVQRSTTVVMETLDNDRTNALDMPHSQTNLLRYGDSVVIKLINADTASTSYLSVRRGNLRCCAAKAPKNSNGYFTIAMDIEGNDQMNLQSSPLKVGDSFYLKTQENRVIGFHRRNVATVGGRLLGLVEKGILPLKLCADLPYVDTHENEKGLESASSENFILSVDTPAWLEILNRDNRQIERAYVIRLLDGNKSLTKLRTEEDLATVLQLVEKESDFKLELHEEESKEQNQTVSPTNHTGSPTISRQTQSSNMIYESNEQESDVSSVDDEGLEVENELLTQQSVDDGFVTTPTTPRKRKKWIKQVAKGVKTGTIKSGTFIGKGLGLKKKGKKKKNEFKTTIVGLSEAPHQSCKNVEDILMTISASSSFQAKSTLSLHLRSDSYMDSVFLSEGSFEVSESCPDLAPLLHVHWVTITNLYTFFSTA